MDVKRFISNYNFRLNHVEGSHYVYIGSVNGKIYQICVPFHSRKAIHPKTMKSIINQSGIDIKDWVND